MSCIEFFVPGVPRPGGSKRVLPIRKKNAEGQMVPTGKFIVTDAAGQGNIDWRASVVHASYLAIQKAQLKPFDGPVAAFFDFVMPRPKYHYNKSGLKAGAPEHHFIKPDVTKLVRAVEDALIRNMLVDDALIVSQTASKKYGDHPGCHIRIVPL